MARNFKTVGQGKLAKACDRLGMIVSEFFEKGRFYSWRLAAYNTAWWVGNYCHPLVRLQFWATRSISKWMDAYLDRYHMAYADLTPPYQSTQPVEDYHIWVFWWQGEEGMPRLVRGCYRQLCKNNTGVVLITRDNIRQWCHIPQYIYDRVEAGDITFTHLSDILRISLLAEHGGLWLDSTCWVPRQLGEEVTGATLISPRTKNLPDLPAWNNYRWCSYSMGTNQKGLPLFVFARNLMYAFFKEHRRFPFYLFIDYIYDHAYRRSEEVRRLFDGVPENNTGRNDLHFLLNTAWDEEKYRRLSASNWAFKLSYKSVWHERTTDGQPTFYGVLIGETE